jgi:tRNA A-37 threonylcarbamoyl transferase component Bud32
MRIQLVPRAGYPDFLDLPWSEPLDEWDHDRLVVAARGIGRHVVRFVDYDGRLFALKELPERIARHEYRLLRELEQEGIPAVEPVGIVRERTELPDVLITRYLDFSLPCRLVIARELVPGPLDRVVDAIADLLVRLHLAGFYWGDCSLSNILVRRDAGALAAYLVDAETSERQPTLSPGQRAYDLEIAEQNVFGELLDLETALGPDESRDPLAVSAEVRERYERLWEELTAEEAFTPGERHRLDERLRRLNELGFDVEEVDLVSTEEGYRLRVDPGVLEPGHHRRLLRRLTGLDAQENQARRLIADLEEFRRGLHKAGRPAVSETAAAGRWLSEVFEPAIAAIPADLWGKREPAELYHELLEHRWYLSERAGRPVPLSDAIESYISTVLRGLDDERAMLRAPEATD